MEQGHSESEYLIRSRLLTLQNEAGLVLCVDADGQISCRCSNSAKDVLGRQAATRVWISCSFPVWDFFFQIDAR